MIYDISCEMALKCMSMDLTDDKINKGSSHEMNTDLWARKLSV